MASLRQKKAPGLARARPGAMVCRRLRGVDEPLPVMDAPGARMEDRGLLGATEVVADDRVVDALVQRDVRQLVVEDLRAPLEVRRLARLIGRDQGRRVLLR